MSPLQIEKGTHHMFFFFFSNTQENEKRIMAMDIAWVKAKIYIANIAHCLTKQLELHNRKTKH